MKSKSIVVGDADDNSGDIDGDVDHLIDGLPGMSGASERTKTSWLYVFQVPKWDKTFTVVKASSVANAVQCSCSVGLVQGNFVLSVGLLVGLMVVSQGGRKSVRTISFAGSVKGWKSLN